MTNGMSTSASMPLLPSSPVPPSPGLTIEDIGLVMRPLTPSLSLSRSGQPLCGALLDGKYLLIGGTSGLDFLPIRASMTDKDRRRPISLIKRTRFRQLVILSERSNVLLAIAGRNDHVRGAVGQTMI